MCLEEGGGGGGAFGGGAPGPPRLVALSLLPYFGTHHFATMHRSDNVLT